MFRTDPDTRRKLLLTPAELQDLMSQPTPPHILAVQSINPYTNVSSRTGRWLPGAVDAEAYTDFAAPATPEDGQRPLPSVPDLQRAARYWGLTDDRPTVVYDVDRAMTAARAWWVLRWAGLRDVRVLDGGLDAWMKAGFDTYLAPAEAVESEICLSGGNMPELDAEGAHRLVQQGGLLLDARIRANYVGGPEEGGDPLRGHIPGAHSAPAPDNFMDEGMFVNGPTLAEIYRGLGVSEDKPIGVYCGAGMSAAVTVLALASIGVDAAMYPGSWSQWINDPTRPVKRGPFP